MRQTEHRTGHRSFEQADESRRSPSGHDAWVIGDEPVVVVDRFGASDYARGK
jgi:hypothetical protein